MIALDRSASTLLLVDFQARLMPAIADAERVLANAGRLLRAARLFDVPVVATEQNADGLGPTVAALELADEGVAVVHKMTFDACRASGFLERVPVERTAVLAGCESHVCLLQTALGLLRAGRRVCVVRDAVGSRQVASVAAALDRLARHGAELVTAEMVVFEWLATAEHPRFREAIALIR